ncbi:TIGR00266 family protein [Oscillatoriales cyanobacterium LEGE 11467]|uniref:TIGR00266 family protein n=1 Tax=Zarconia navalis LEGE 11467 TaxID=1828826 RepID=A0A928Z991_9CYAN|nr:TIGR00266 family protein [Zarconia navalis]MBE9041439.1 TIGR00266 family protein [Zarconia navalis LEGE 11467]
MVQEIAYKIEHSPAYASLVLHLNPQQTVLVESGAMAAMDSGIQMKSKAKGGLMKGIGRLVSGESFFVSEFTAGNQPAELYVSPGVPGDVRHYALQGNNLMIQGSGFVACSLTVNIETKFQGFKGFFSGESLFLIRATGEGDVWFSSYGAIVEIPVDGDYVVDTGYIVAFEDTLQYKVEMLGGLSFKGLRTGILGGEGLVCRFSGRGRLWVQSRNLYRFINFINPFRPAKS